MGDLLIGTSGWSYEEWKGVFYPSSSTNKLSFYSSLFSTAEIDSTFYAFPSKGLVNGWARNTPDSFVFSAKLPRLITHEKKLSLESGAETELVKFLSLMKPLIASGRMGPILIQLPPSFSYEKDRDRLTSFLAVLPEDVRFVVEFRHPSWLREDVWSELESRNVANAIVDEPLLPPDPIVTTDFAFVRWHGRGAHPWYNYRYNDKELQNWAPKVEEVARKSKKVYGYFNNHFRGFAIENSLKMMALLGASGARQDEARNRATAFLEGGKVAARGETSMLEFMGDTGHHT